MVQVCVPTITFVDVARANRFSWEMINELRSNQMPVLIMGDIDTKVKYGYRVG